MNPLGVRFIHSKYTEKSRNTNVFFRLLDTEFKRENFIKKDQERKGILVISPLERLLPQQDTSKKVD